MALNDTCNQKLIEETIKSNQVYYDQLKLAVANQSLDEHFSGIKVAARFLEIVNTMLCFPDGVTVVYDMYDYIIKNIKDIHIPVLMKQLSDYEIFHPLFIRDFDQLYYRTLNSQDGYINTTISFIDAMFQIPTGDLLIANELKGFLNVTNPVFISNAISKFKDKPFFPELISKNFVEWINLSRSQSTIEIIELMLEVDEAYTLAYIKENFINILKNTGGGRVSFILEIFSNYDELVPLIKDGMDEIIDYCDASDINSILLSLDEKLNLNIQENNDILKLLSLKLSDEKQDHYAVGAIVKSKKSEYLKSLLKNMIKEEQVDDFYSIGDKSWANIVFKVGSKVLKLGWVRNNPECDDHYRIIKPKHFETICNEDGEAILFIEIQDLLPQEDISKEDIEDFYRDLKNEGYIYIDPKGNDSSNFGVLSEKDKQKYESEYNVSDSFKKKALVLLDRDCVWKENDPNIKYMGRY